MLIRLAVVALFALAGLSAAHEGVQGLQLMNVTVDEGPILGLTPRTYWLYTPTARAGNASMPLVVYFHGQGGGGSPLGGFFDPNTTKKKIKLRFACNCRPATVPPTPLNPHRSIWLGLGYARRGYGAWCAVAPGIVPSL